MTGAVIHPSHPSPFPLLSDLIHPLFRMSSPGSQRLWVGPLMLILVIAVIYVFSLMPSAPPHRVS